MVIRTVNSFVIPEGKTFIINIRHKDKLTVQCKKTKQMKKKTCF